MGRVTGQPNRQFLDNMVNQLDDNMGRQKQHDKTLFASIVLQLNCTKSPMSYLFFV